MSKKEKLENDVSTTSVTKIEIEFDLTAIVLGTLIIFLGLFLDKYYAIPFIVTELVILVLVVLVMLYYKYKESKNVKNM